MTRLLIAVLLLLPATGFAQSRVDIRTQITPFMQKAADRQLYTLRTDVEQNSRRRWKRAWIASWVAFAAANILDTRSSQGKYEANPLLRNSDGTFASGRATGLKAGVGAALFGTQLWMIHKKPEKNLYKGFSMVNGAAAGALSAVAVSNSTK
jgi:hypothetical protein